MQRNILISTLPLLISIFLIIAVAKIGLGKVLSLREEISQAETDKTILTEKLNTLTSLSADLQSNSQLSSYALPDKNPALSVISQLKSLGNQNLVSLSKIKSGTNTGGPASVSSVGVTFEVIGPKDGIIAFLTSLKKIAPLIQIDKIKLSQVVDQANASISVASFWAPYPTKLPEITSPISNLSADEVTTLSAISRLTPPQFVSLSPSTTAGKSDPFSQ